MKRWKFPFGMRTLKSVVAVILAIIVADRLSSSGSRLIFAMLGAMAAMQPTLLDSLRACITDIVGVLFGALVTLLLLTLPLHPLVRIGIGMIAVICVYNGLRVNFSPSLPCFIVVMLCTTPGTDPMSYALGRVWDTAIGLGVGLLVNTLIVPYDNSRQIHATAQLLEKEVIAFLEDMFDGDDCLPDAGAMTRTIDTMAGQLKIFSNQRLLLRLRQQKKQREAFALCEGKARELLARMEVLSRMERPGRLNEKNRRRLQAAGARIRDTRPLDSVLERDVVTNYHVRQILRLRRELLETLEN